MENIALIDSFSEFKDDKLIDRVTLMAILEDVFRNALKKKFGSDDNFDIIINPDKGDMEIWQRRVIVADDDLDLDHLEITLTEARKIEPDFEIGEEVSEEVKLIDLGRRAILALRQNLISKIHEHDNKAPQGFGLIYKGRLVCFYDAECDLGDGWEDADVHNDPKEVREKALKMGCNILNYIFNN